MRKLIDTLPLSLRWTPHNLIAHPVSEILYLLSLLFHNEKIRELSNYIHDETIPTHHIGEGRG